MMSRLRRLGRAACVLALVLALLAPGVARAQTSQEVQQHGISNLQYVVRGTFVLTFAALVFILVQAARSPSQDTSRLKAGLDAVDRGLARAFGRQAAERGAHDTRLQRQAHRGLHPSAE
jgi:hypothetical protein